MYFKKYLDYHFDISDTPQACHCAHADVFKKIKIKIKMSFEPRSSYIVGQI